jgi:hypothetical protein
MMLLALATMQSIFDNLFQTSATTALQKSWPHAALSEHGCCSRVIQTS